MAFQFKHGKAFLDDLHLRKHKCTLPDRNKYYTMRLPPNASLCCRFVKWFHKFLTPNPNLAICKRNFRNENQIKAELKRHINHKYWYVIHPYSYMELVRGLFLIGYFTWVVIVSGPLEASFEWIAKYRPNLAVSIEDQRCFLCPYAFVILTTLIWIISCFLSGYEEHQKHKGSIQLDLWKIAKRYLKSFFLIDLLVIIPCPFTDIYLGICLWVKVIIAFTRMHTFIHYISRFSTDFKIPASIQQCIILVHISLIFCHVFTCFFYFVPVIMYNGKGQLWILNSNVLENPAAMLYYSLHGIVQSHFWGLGSAHINTDNNMEKLVLIIVMITGRLWGLYIFASVLSVFTVTSMSETKYEKYLKHLQIFISQNNIPKEMEQRLLEFYEYKFQNNYFKESAIFTTLSLYLRQTLNLFWARKVINKVKVFEYFPQSMIADIISKCRVLVFLNHDYIAREGDLITHIYFISSGTVAIFDKYKNELYHTHDGDEIGVGAIGTFKQVRYRRTHIAIETTEIYAIDIKEFKEIIGTRNDILKFFQKKVEEREIVWQQLEKAVITTQKEDLLAELRNERILERPRVRTIYLAE